jgi:Co/Zn/Cd efflux system component
MTRNTREAILSTVADFFTGMATAWLFAAIASLYQLVWLDLLSSLFLAILSLSAAISAKLELYAKHP